MAYAHRVKRLTFSGTCFGGQEIWSTGLFIGIPGSDVGTASQAEVDGYSLAFKNFWVASANAFHSAYIFTQTKLSVLDTAGHPDPLNTVYNSALPWAGASAGSAMVPQASIVASLRVPATRGLASHGRMFLPGNAYGINNTDGRISTFNIGVLATNFKAFINAINAGAPSGEHVSLASFGTTTPTVQPGVTNTVTHIELGNVYDTQRRRRNGLVETYNNQTIP